MGRIIPSTFVSKHSLYKPAEEGKDKESVCAGEDVVEYTAETTLDVAVYPSAAEGFIYVDKTEEDKAYDSIDCSCDIRCR